MTSRKQKISIFSVCLVFLMIASLACAYLKTKTSVPIPESHPIELEKGRVQCIECHEEPLEGSLKPVETFNHTSTFIQFHREYGSSEGRLCQACHSPSFCIDCHTTKDELKPSQKHGDRADRIFPHRGDYLTKHKIDGKIMPEVCFRCHGRQNNALCRNCHK